MPLLKRKAIKPVPPPSLSDFDRNLPVFMMPFTNEIFTSYEDYINRYMFYQQKTWQCETTGKSGLTFKQALESEQKEKDMVANKFPPQLRKPLLQFVQFQTTRIDAVVDDAFAKFKDVYYHNETVNVSWDGSTYGAVIRKVPPREEWTEVKDGAEEPEMPGQYHVQVVDQRGKGIPDMERVVDCSLLSRDRLAFNKNILRKYIRECTAKEAYIGAPWLVKSSLCKKYDIETKLPADLKEARDKAFSKLKKRKGPTDPAPELAALKKAKKEAEKAKESTPVDPVAAPVAAEPKVVIKYPIEDLDLDLKLIAKASDEGSVAVRPVATIDNAIPQDSFESVIMTWQFLNTFSSPLKLTPFGFKDFQDSLAHTDDRHPSVMISEYHTALMNVIIQDRLKGIAKPIFASNGSGPTSTGAREDREGSMVTDDEGSATDDGEDSVGGDFIQHRQKQPHRPINERVVVVGQGWDEKQVPISRQGWEAVLVGLVNEMGSFEAIPNVDRILNHLVPNDTTTKDEVEFLFPSLPYEDKVHILVFLVETASGTSAIRHYMEQCREQLKELRLEKFEINKERRRLQTERIEFERQESAGSTGTTAESATEDAPVTSAVATPEISFNEDSDAEAALTRTESRQEKLKRQQQEREQEETRRAQDLARQRAVTKAKSAEQKARHDARKKLLDQEHALARKEEQVDRDTQRFAIARIKPLGKDRFFNRYWYFDGITMTHGTDRIYIQSPSFLDLETMRTRSDKDNILRRQGTEDPSCGLGELLKYQEADIIRGITAEKAARERKLQMEKEREVDTDDEDVTGESTTSHHAGHGLTNGLSTPLASQEYHMDETKAVEHMSPHWSYYSEPEQVDQLLQWLNVKGVRERVLVDAIDKQYDMIVGGMQRRHHDLVKQLERDNHRRSTRTKTVQASEGYLGYVNKLNK